MSQKPEKPGDFAALMPEALPGALPGALPRGCHSESESESSISMKKKGMKEKKGTQV
jgi:hypothetical protein